MSQALQISPWDEHNRKLVSCVHPADWINPVPQGRYNLVVVGAGTAGLVSAAVAAGLGARVALVERHLMGGDCLNVGCVPSKSIIRAARALSAVREAERFGIDVPPGTRVDFTQVMRRMRRIRSQIAPHDSAQRYAGELGVDVYLGEARFSGPDRLEVAGAELSFARAVIATGGARGSTADRRASGHRVSDQRDVVRADRAAGTPGGDWGGTDRLRDGPDLSPLRIGGQPVRDDRPHPAARGRRRRAGRAGVFCERRGGPRARRYGPARRTDRWGGSSVLRARGPPGAARIRPDSGRRRTRPQRRRIESGGGGRGVRPKERSPRRRLPAHAQQTDLRRGRRLSGVQVHPHRGCRRQDRGPERAVFPLQEVQRPGGSVVYLHRTGNRSCGPVRARRGGGRPGIGHLHGAAGAQRPFVDRRRRGGFRARPHQTRQ